MILKESILSVSDNCGVLLTKCFGFYKLKKYKNIKILKFIKVSYKKTKKMKNIIKKKKSKAFFFRSRFLNKKIDGSYFSFYENSCVLIKKRLYTRGRLVRGCVLYNTKRKKFINSFNFVL